MRRRDLHTIRIRARERTLLARHIALYLRAGISILEALELVRASSRSLKQKRLLQQVIADVQEGLPLSKALSRFPRVYTSMHIQLISAGELSGTLSLIMASLAQMMDERVRRIRSIMGALAYPIVLFLGSLAVCSFLLLYAFPKIVPIFRGLHATLPFTTRALVSLSSFFHTHWLAVLCTNAAAALAILLAFRIPRMQAHLDSATLRLPLAGNLLKQSIAVFVFRTLGALLASGIRLDEALELIRGGISNTACKDAVERIRQSILSGNKLSHAFSSESFLFPPVAIQLISVGEMTGSLSETAASAATILEEDVAERLRFLTAALEPMIMITMGLIIGFIALAIISPMYGITQTLTI